MYPAQALVDGAYTYEDLPDAIDVAGVVFTKIDPPESVAGFTRYYVNANDEYLGILDGEEESLWSYEGGGGACLINGTFSQDQFADSYTGTYGIYDPITLTRVSLCEWTGEGVGTEDQPYTVSLIYETDYKWHVKVEIDSVNYDWIKDDPQSSPEGNFEGNFTVS